MVKREWRKFSILVEDRWESSGELFRHFSVKKVTNTNIYSVKLNVLLKVVLVYVMKFVIYLVGIFLGRTKNTFHTTDNNLICNQVRYRRSCILMYSL